MWGGGGANTREEERRVGEALQGDANAIHGGAKSTTRSRPRAHVHGSPPVAFFLAASSCVSHPPPLRFPVMGKIRVFRLGRRLARVWRWVRRQRRPCNRSYLRFRPTEHSSPSNWSPQVCGAKLDRTAVAAKIASWGRSLTRRLRLSSGKEDNTRRLLGDGDDDHYLWEPPPPPPPPPQQQQREEVEGEEDWWKTPPKGHLPVYVGRKDVEPPRRVLVPVIYFNHPLFGELLRGAAEEFDFRHPGGITIPCPISDFESVRTRVAASSGVACRHGGRSPRARRWPLTLS